MHALADLVEQHLQGWPTKVAFDSEEGKRAHERAIAMGAKY